MCCNADILFSVLVLHWVTSKDSYSSSSYAQSRTTQPNPSRNTRNRLGSFDLYTRPGGRDLGTVTTHISAFKSGKGGGEEDIGDMQLGGITIKVGQVVEVEREIDVTFVEGKRSRSQTSTEGLVEKSPI